VHPACTAPAIGYCRSTAGAYLVAAYLPGAPEQLRAAPATPAVDIFAWGCLLARLAGGVHPFASRSEQEWILRIQLAQPDLSRVPVGLAEVIRATLARNPRHRPNADELAAICRAGGDQPPQPVPVPWPPLETAAARRHPAPVRRGGRDRPAGTGQPWTMGHLLDTTVTRLLRPDGRWPL
jgi:serine/threonine protein kinase